MKDESHSLIDSFVPGNPLEAVWTEDSAEPLSRTPFLVLCALDIFTAAFSASLLGH